MHLHPSHRSRFQQCPGQTRDGNLQRGRIRPMGLPSGMRVRGGQSPCLPQGGQALRIGGCRQVAHAPLSLSHFPWYQLPGTCGLSCFSLQIGTPGWTLPQARALCTERTSHHGLQARPWLGPQVSWHELQRGHHHPSSMAEGTFACVQTRACRVHRVLCPRSKSTAPSVKASRRP